MKRKIYDKLVQWKHEQDGATALLIEGARRIGKSYIAEEFARNEYDSYIMIDFSKAPARVKSWFDEYLEDVDTLLQNIHLHYKKTLTPRKSLIIFDEVHKCPRAREAIKTLVADHRFDYLETGSLISIKKNVENIVIPSEEEGIDMSPMDFEEFLWAMGNEVLMPYIQKQFEQQKSMGDFHRDAMHYFRQYMIVGGMPQAVAEYVQSKDFNKVDAVKRRILRLYQNDIKKYAGSARMREYDSAFFWLDDARIVNICYNTTAPNIGLQLNEDRTTLKCYFCDTGLLISLAFNARGIVSNEIYQKLMFEKLEINEGMLVENVVAQMLKATDKKLFFYSCGNYDMMSRDGVFETYKKYHIPPEIEDAWSRELKQTLLDDILTRRIFQRVYPLSRLMLPESEIIEAFQILSGSPEKERIQKEIRLLERFFEPEMLKSILAVFSSPEENPINGDGSH